MVSLFVVTNTFALNLDSIQLKLKDYQQEDQLAEWLESYLTIESFLYEKDEVTAAENTLNHIVEEVWRKPITQTENDLFFILFWYKAFYAKDNGKIVAAKDNFEKSLNYYANSSKIYQEDLLIIYPPLGNIYTILGENDKAIIAHQKMIELVNSLAKYDGKDDDLATAYTNLAIVFETQKQLDLAIETIEKVKRLQSVSNYNLGVALSNYGKFLFQQDKLNEADRELKNAISLLQTVDHIDKYYLGGIYKTMAFISTEKGNLIVANQFLDLAIENYKNSPIVRNREIAKSYLEKSKNSSNKMVFLNIALQYLIPHKKKFPVEYFPNKKALFAENTLADIFYEETKLRFDPSIILKCYESYFEVQKLIRKEYLFKNSKKTNLQQDRKVIDEAIAFCYFMFSKNKEEKYAIKALEFIENEKSILLYESLAKNNTSNQNEDYLLYLSEKKTLINDLVAAQLINDSIQEKELKEQIKKIDFDNEINTKNSIDNTINLQDFDILDFKENFLQKNEALIVFHDALDLYSIIVTKEHVAIQKTEKTNQFTSNLKAFTHSFSFENRYNFNNEIATNLGEAFIKIIPSETQKIYLATDGILNNIPFEAFKNKEHFFLENYEFQYIFSANILQNIKYQKVNNHRLLAIAPIFENDNKKQLLKSEEEVLNVLKKLKGKSLLNSEANTTNFLKEAKDFAILHISSHAQIDKKLKVASIDFFDKSLYFSQIEQEQFETQLLVLSACETGIGKQEAGEGTLSLSKAFAYSKIPSIISSLWKVNEESSLEIFNSFYENIQAKKSISTSLRDAKLAYLNNPEIAEEKKQPYYWASFILLGEDNVLEVEKANNIPKYTFFVLGFVLLLIYVIKSREIT